MAPDAEPSQTPNRSRAAELSRVPYPLATCSFLLIGLRPEPGPRRQTEPRSHHARLALGHVRTCMARYSTLKHQPPGYAT